MDTPTLVTEDIEWGISLVSILREDQFPFDLVAWIYDAEVGGWRLVISTPIVDSDGALEAYRRIGGLIRKAELPDSTLPRVAVVSPADTVVAHFRSQLKSQSWAGVDVPVIEDSTGFQRAERAYLYEVDHITYEEAVLAALQRVVSQRAVIRRADRLFFADVGFDFIVDDGVQRFAVEVKASSRPLSVVHLRSLIRNYRARPSVLLVAKSDVTDDAAHWLTAHPDIRFVRWQSPEDDNRLAEATGELLAS